MSKLISFNCDNAVADYIDMLARNSNTTRTYILNQLIQERCGLTPVFLTDSFLASVDRPKLHEQEGPKERVVDLLARSGLDTERLIEALSNGVTCSELYHMDKATRTLWINGSKPILSRYTKDAEAVRKLLSQHYSLPMKKYGGRHFATPIA